MRIIAARRMPPVHQTVSREGSKVFKKALVIAAMVAPVIVASAVAQQAAIKRTPLQTVDFPPGFTTISAIVEIPPGVCAGRHTHPGIESSYVMDGQGILKVADKPDQPLKAGDSLQIPPATPHDACAAAGQSAKLLVVYVVEKGKPPASPAP